MTARAGGGGWTCPRPPAPPAGWPGGSPREGSRPAACVCPCAFNLHVRTRPSPFPWGVSAPPPVNYQVESPAPAGGARGRCEEADVRSVAVSSAGTAGPGRGPVSLVGVPGAGPRPGPCVHACGRGWRGRRAGRAGPHSPEGPAHALRVCPAVSPCCHLLTGCTSSSSRPPARHWAAASSPRLLQKGPSPGCVQNVMCVCVCVKNLLFMPLKKRANLKTWKWHFRC